MEKKTYKPLNRFTVQSEELRKLITKHPDYPLIIMVDSDVVADDGYNWWYAPGMDFSVGEILDCQQDINDEKTYIDRDEFAEDVEDWLTWNEDYGLLSDKDFERVVKKKVAEYDQYWKKVIIIRATL